MKLRGSLLKSAPSVPTASMADIAFLLIIFFMLTTSFSPERTAVQLPSSLIRTEVAKDAAIVAVTSQGEIHFTDGEQPSFPLTTIKELGPLTATIVKLIPDRQFLIKADRTTRYQVIDQVLEALRDNGAQNVGLLTDRKTLTRKE